MDTDQKLNQIIALLSTLTSAHSDKILNSIKESVKTLQIERAKPAVEAKENTKELKSNVIGLRKKNMELKSRVKELENSLLYDTKNPTEKQLRNEVKIFFQIF